MYGNALDTQDALYESRPFPYSSAMVVKVDASMWRGDRREQWRVSVRETDKGILKKAPLGAGRRKSVD